MRFVIGAALVLLAALFATFSRGLAERVSRSNAAFFDGKAFTGTGWTSWNRFVMLSIACVLGVAGLLSIFGVVDFTK